jgi:hypothetical protein
MRIVPNDAVPNWRALYCALANNEGAEYWFREDADYF